MSPAKKKPICKVCPKRKPCRVVQEYEEPEEGIFELPVEEEEAEEEAETEEEICLEEESCKEIATAGYVLDEIPKKKKERPPFFCPAGPKARYENMLPMDVTNDHQADASNQITVIDHLSALRVTSEPFCKRRPVIIATIGPSCMEVNQIEELLDAGMNVARINMAYGDRCCQLNAIRNFKIAVKNYSARIGMKIPVGLMMDLKGPEIRTGRICRLYACDPENPQVLIEKNSVVKLTTEITYVDKCTPTLIYIDFPSFPQYVRPGMKIYIDDGSIHLTVQKVTDIEVITFVEVAGYLRNYRPIHVPMVPLAIPALTNLDVEDIDLAVEEEFDFIAVSKIENSDVLHNLKCKMIESLLMAKKLREKPIMILSKISNFQALRNIDEIIEATDGIIIQRGDLGLELPPEKVYVAQREIIGKCNLANKPVICSSQLMRSMTRRPLADRSHIFDVAGCIEDGADGICLTGETAIGDFPADVVEQTHNILREAEAADARKYHFKELTEKLRPPIEPVMAIGMAACIVAEKLRASAIIVLTTSGRSAQIISWFRPRCVVLAVTRFERTARQMHLWRSICPLIYDGPCVKNNWFANLDQRFQYGITFGKEVGFIRAGDPLVLVSGYGKSTAFTNCLRVVYASTQPGIYLQHPIEFYNNIYLQRNCPRGHIDLWTREASGCQCNYDSEKLSCACCAKGGCSCGRVAPKRCTQCGLESYCPRFCNMTLDSRELLSRSGKSFGQIKSPSLKGPAVCYYTFIPLPKQRIELQFYRLVNLGIFNGTDCHGGFLQLVESSDSGAGATEIKICGNNDRYDPPVLIFADRGPATLIFQLSDDSFVSQFVAYYSFTSTSSKQGIYAKGGKRVGNTGCDWLYQDFECRASKSCILTSPGYPGVYAPNRRCKYHIAISSMQTRVTISFVSILLPEKQCNTDFIAIYQGASVTSPRIAKICGNKKRELSLSGPNLLIEFRSGPPLPPYGYNGFRAFLNFSEVMYQSHSNSSINFITPTTESNLLMDGTISSKVSLVKNGCDLSFSGNETRSGTFDTRSLKWSSSCLFTFYGKMTDVVHVSLFNYYMRGASCSNAIEIYDGMFIEGIKPTQKICSPIAKRARDSSTGRFIEQQTFVSTDNILSIRFRRSLTSHNQDQVEFLDGAYLFHNEQVDGTLRPSTLCDVDYYGLSSLSTGMVSNPGTQDLYFNIERPLQCVQRFIPAANQSITLVISKYKMIEYSSNCHTQCGDGGCFCVVNARELAQVDHLMLQTENGQTLSCLCGEFQEDWLPVTLKSWSPVRLIYHVADFNWDKKGFSFNAYYSFTTDGICGHFTLTNPDGEIESVRIIPDGQLNYYYHQRCTWLLDTKIERQLTVELHTPQNRNCGAWNLTLHNYDEGSPDRSGKLIDTFCPRQRHKVFELPWKVDLIVIRLQATTHTPPEFTIRWRSQVFKTNNRISDPSPLPSSFSYERAPLKSLVILIICHSLAVLIESFNYISLRS